MRALVVGVMLLIVAAAGAATPPATAPTVMARVSSSDVSVGEPFTIEVRASGPPGCTFAFPAEASTDSFELATEPVTPAAKGTAPPSDVHRYRAAVFALGAPQVPPIPVRYRLADGREGEAHTAAIPLHVHSLLPKAKDEQKLADVRAPVALSVGRLFWIGLAVLAVGLGALVFWLLARRRIAVVGAPAAPALTPEQEARRALEALAASGRLARGEYRVFYIELTAIAKRYLERRLEAPIVEMTTAEMLGHLRSAPHTSEMAPLLRDLSGAADQIKFARGRGGLEEGERHLASVQALIDGLEARLRPPTPESGAAA
jgi:hypothetical protein